MPFDRLRPWCDAYNPQQLQRILVCGASVVLVFTACGINFSFGVYQEHYEILDGPFRSATAGAISLIGTLASSIMMLGAPLVNSSMKVYGTRATVTGSGILFALAGITASFGTQLWHFQVTQGMIQGCAICLAYIPAVTITPRIFNTRRGLAMGIVTSGTGLGGVIWAPLLRYLLTTNGFRLTLAFAGLLSAILIATVATAFEHCDQLMDDTTYASERENMEIEAHKNIPPSQAENPTTRTSLFITHTLASALQSAAYFTPLFFMSSFARSLGFSETNGANIIALCNLCNCIGKVVIGYIADKLGRVEMLGLSTATSALVSLGLAWAVRIEVSTTALGELLLLYAMLYGASAGAYVALLPTALVEHFGARGFAKTNSLVYMFRGLGTLVGTWIAGSLMKMQIHSKVHDPADFVLPFVFVGSSLSGAAVLVLWSIGIANHGKR